MMRSARLALSIALAAALVAGVAPSHAASSPTLGYWHFDRLLTVKGKSYFPDASGKPALRAYVTKSGAGGVLAASTDHAPTAIPNTGSVSFLPSSPTDATTLKVPAFSDGDGDLTVEAFIKIPTPSASAAAATATLNVVPFAFRTSPLATGPTLYLQLLGPTMNATLASSGTGTVSAYSVNQLLDGKWHHVAIVHTCPTAQACLTKLYVDRQLVGAVPSGPRVPGDGGYLVIGTFEQDVPFTGSIDELRVTAAALDPADMLK